MTQKALEEASLREEVNCATHKELEEERVCGEFQCMVQEETQCHTYRKAITEYQVSDFLHCCLETLGGPIVAKKLTHMSTRRMEEGETNVAISNPLPE
jgi:hypothetical protein